MTSYLRISIFWLYLSIWHLLFDACYIRLAIWILLYVACFMWLATNCIKLLTFTTLVQLTIFLSGDNFLYLWGSGSFTFTKRKRERLQVLLVKQGLTVCWFCVCVSVWDDFQASDWLKHSEVAQRRQTSYDVAKLLLIVQMEFYPNFWCSSPLCDQNWWF